MENINEFILNLLRNEVVPATGCTEPVAVALNVAYGTEQIKDEINTISNIEVKVSRAIFKNGKDVGIPGTDNEIGLEIASALGAAIAESGNGLQILGNIKSKDEILAKEIENKDIINLYMVEGELNNLKVYIESKITYKDGYVKVITRDRHDNIVYLEKNGTKIIDKEYESATKDVDNKEEFFNLKILDIVEAIENMDTDDLRFLLDGIDMNLNAAKYGIENKCGLGVGYNYNKSMESGLVARDVPNLAYMLTSAASDVRMSGKIIPIMSSSGSGNNGITAILPIVALVEVKGNISEEKIIKGLAISHTITSYVKKHIGRLSNICGCSLAASVGVGAAIAWILDGKKYINGTINNVIGNLAGVICDGAKPSCSLKLGTAASTAVQSAFIAINGTEINFDNGIVDPASEKSIRNLARISSEGMKYVDETVVNIMQER